MPVNTSDSSFTVASTITQYTDALARLARGAITLTTNKDGSGNLTTWESV